MTCEGRGVGCGRVVEESRRASEYAQTAARAEELERRAEQLEAQLAEEQTTSNAQRNQVLAEATRANNKSRPQSAL